MSCICISFKAIKHSRVGNLTAKNIFSTTTRPIPSKTVIYNDDAHSDASMFWKSQDPTENDMSYDADIIRWHSFATKKQRCNVDNNVIHSCGNSVKTMSKQENPNADQRLHGGTRLPLHMTFKPLEHNLLCNVHDGTCGVCCNCICICGHQAQQEPR